MKQSIYTIALEARLISSLLNNVELDARPSHYNSATYSPYCTLGGIRPVNEGDILVAHVQRGKYVFGKLLPQLIQQESASVRVAAFAVFSLFDPQLAEFWYQEDRIQKNKFQTPTSTRTRTRKRARTTTTAAATTTTTTTTTKQLRSLITAVQVFLNQFSP